MNLVSGSSFAASSLPASPTPHAGLNQWIAECARLCEPEQVQVCDGSDDEYDALIALMLGDGTLTALNRELWPNCYLHRSHPNDVARVEQSTFICTPRQDNAGPTNNWMAPDQAKDILRPLFQGSMRGKTLYVVPYLMGPVGSLFAKVGVEITDSAYVAASLRLMTRMGQVALDHLGTGGEFAPGLHAIGTLDPQARYICHFPDENLIWSYGSNYGGNALLAKKCFALRIASKIARDEGWLAEHMLLLEVTHPDGTPYYFAGAFPSATGKTNLAMLIVPPDLAAQGWRARTVGDDIAWMHVKDGRLYAINPEAGFFGVVPGTSQATNPNALATIARNTIFTNVAVSDDGQPWWEGKDGPGAPCPFEYLTDWRGQRRRVGDAEAPYAHPNSRFTAPAWGCPSLSPHFDEAGGVPISGILFGGRRTNTAPLILQARNWTHGAFLGACLASQTTAAAEGATGVLRRDPMAMLPFCGYNMGDYFQHWLEVGARLTDAPGLFQVNWFRRGPDGHFLWPGFGENLRPLIWAIGRLRGEASATETPAGYVPAPDDLPLDHLDMPRADVEAALAVVPSEWQAEANLLDAHLNRFGDHLPHAFRDELAALHDRLGV